MKFSNFPSASDFAYIIQYLAVTLDYKNPQQIQNVVAKMQFSVLTWHSFLCFFKYSSGLSFNTVGKPKKLSGKKGSKKETGAGLHIQSQQRRRKKEISKKQGKTAAAQYA